VESILCYQCNSTDVDDPYQCEEFLGEHGGGELDIVPKSCDQVYGAAYCIKHTGRFEVGGLLCYQCSSEEEMSCLFGNGTNENIYPIRPTSCDQVFEARYCVKATGGIGTKRYCSSIDMGNYCNYIKQPGDLREYRSCVYTCSSDGCNGVGQLSLPSQVVTIFIAISTFITAAHFSHL
ncbi:hypothetical protein AAG570_002364, partial [Ranatra chinensis]